MAEIERLCIHTMTTRPWTLRQAVDGYRAAGAAGITVWQEHLESAGVAEGARTLADSGLRVAGYCRGGFFPGHTASERSAALDRNRVAIDEAAAIGAPVLVLVCGAVPGIPLDDARRQIADGIAAILPHARAAGVTLAIEPLHPMYAADRSAVNTLSQANDMIDALGDEGLGIAIDVYHTWWDPALEAEIARAGARIVSFHVSDWRLPTRDILNDRALMGDGCIPIATIRSWVERAGFRGPVEVEIFSGERWIGDQARWVSAIKERFVTHA